MPIGTRLSTPIPRTYIHEERLTSIADPQTREAYLLAKLMADNLGRLPANPATLAGILFPANPPKPGKMSEIIRSWCEAGLVFHYSFGARAFIEIADNGLTSRLVGNMSTQSEYPAPPQEMIDEWVKKFGEWRSIVQPEKRSTYAVDTRSNKSEHVPTCIAEEKGVVEKGVEENRRELVGKVGGNPEMREERFNPDQPTNQVLLGSLFKTLKPFKGKIVGTKEFQRLVLLKLQDAGDIVQSTDNQRWERFFSSVLDEADQRKILYPREWYRVLNVFRERIEQAGDGAS
jgi:hypothetical protein